MDKLLDKYLKNRPQRLCHMCGKCCRLSTTSRTYKELKKLVREGDEGATEFLRVFEPYSSIDEARKASKETVDNIVEALLENDAYDETQLTFYKCRYIQDDNLCGIYKDRPELCERFPSTPWAVVPPGCGFEGWLFQQREEKKQNIRRMKEDILSLEVMLKKTNNLDEMKKILDTIDKIKHTINLYAKYGSSDW